MTAAPCRRRESAPARTADRCHCRAPARVGHEVDEVGTSDRARPRGRRCPGPIRAADGVRGRAGVEPLEPVVAQPEVAQSPSIAAVRSPAAGHQRGGPRAITRRRRRRGERTPRGERAALRPRSRRRGVRGRHEERGRGDSRRSALTGSAYRLGDDRHAVVLDGDEPAVDGRGLVTALAVDDHVAGHAPRAAGCGRAGCRAHRRPSGRAPCGPHRSRRGGPPRRVRPPVSSTTSGSTNGDQGGRAGGACARSLAARQSRTRRDASPFATLFTGDPGPSRNGWYRSDFQPVPPVPRPSGVRGSSGSPPTDARRRRGHRT